MNSSNNNNFSALEIEDSESDNNELRDDDKNTKQSKKVVFEGHIYDLEDGQLVSYIEIYIPLIRKYIKINACDLVKYIFGNHFKS